MITAEELRTSCLAVLGYAEERDYAGYSKFDALSSPFLRMVAGGSYWRRLLLTQGVTRAPVNLRPWLGVPRRRNPKGVALFAMAYLNLHRLEPDGGHAPKARALLDWLLSHPSSYSFPGLAWGYLHPWQDQGFYAPAGFPNRVVTCFVGQAFLDACEVLKESRYLDAAGEAVRFVLEAPKVLYEDARMKCLSYVPSEEIDWVVMDVSALSAALVARWGHLAGENRSLEEAHKLMAYVVDKQTPQGAWYYSHPPEASRVKIDNYHTGFILDALWDFIRYTRSESSSLPLPLEGRGKGEGEYMDAYRKGLDFYRENLFDGPLPKWRSDRKLPLDIHGAAQGIITFCRARELGDGYFGKALSVAEWAIGNMQSSEDGHFYYQKGRLWTKRYPLMRWGQAWMARALSTLLLTMEKT
jgi:hypothetical protein